jgi:hypothetical protein
MNRATKSLKFDAGLWKEMKLHCVKNDIEISDFVEKLVREKLKK